MSFGEVLVTDFADDAMRFAGTTEILLQALELLNKEGKLLRLRVPLIKTKV